MDDVVHPHVTLVTVTYGDRVHLCSETVDRAVAAGVEHVVVVGNGLGPSQKDALEGFLRDHRAATEYIDLPFNYGSAGGYHVGIGRAAEKARLILLLDDDNHVEPSFLDTMLATKEDLDSRLGGDFSVCGMRTKDPQHRSSVARGRSFPPAGSFMYFDLLQRVGRGRPGPEPESDRLLSIPYAPYGGLLLSAALVRRVGLPRPEFILYEDDTEFTSRVAEQSGIFLCPDAVVSDADGKWTEVGEGRLQSLGPGRMVLSDSDARLYYSTRNRVCFDLARARGMNRARFLMNITIFTMILVIAGSLLRRWGNLRLLGGAFVDGLRGRLGIHQLDGALQLEELRPNMILDPAVLDPEVGVLDAARVGGQGQ